MVSASGMMCTGCIRQHLGGGRSEVTARLSAPRCTGCLGTSDVHLAGATWYFTENVPQQIGSCRRVAPLTVCDGKEITAAPHGPRSRFFVMK